MNQLRNLILSLVVILTVTTAALAQQSFSDHITASVAAMQAGDNKKAIDEATEAIRLNPNSADAYYLRSNLRSNTDDNAGALADLDRVIALRPHSGEAFYSRAIANMVKGDSAAAIKDFDQALANNFVNDNVYTMRAGLRSQTGDAKGALSDVNEALRLNPNNPRSYLTRAALYMELSDLDHAMTDLDFLLNWYETDPSARPLPKASEPTAVPSPSADKKPGESKDEGFSIQMSVATVNEAPSSKEMIPVIQESYYRRGIIRDQLKRFDAAIADYTQSIKLVPNDGDSYFLRARSYEAKQNWEAALKDANKVVELMPTNGNGLVERGVILQMMGRTADARADFDLLLKSDAALWQKKIDDRLAAVQKLATIH